MFYRFMNDGNVRWRKLLYAMNLQLIKKIQCQTTVKNDKPVCLIIDDTDAPKSGKHTELIGRVWSHVQQRSILAISVLRYFSDGTSQLMLDFFSWREKVKKRIKNRDLPQRSVALCFTEDHPDRS